MMELYSKLNIHTSIHTKYISKYKQSTFYRGALLWNDLSAATRNIASYIPPLNFYKKG